MSLGLLPVAQEQQNVGRLLPCRELRRDERLGDAADDLGCCSASCAPGLLLKSERKALSTSYSNAMSCSLGGTRECSPERKLESTGVPFASTKFCSQPRAHVRSVTASDSMCLLVTEPSINFLMNHSGELRISTIVDCGAGAETVLGGNTRYVRSRSRSALFSVSRSLYTSVHFLSTLNVDMFCRESLDGGTSPVFDSKSRRSIRSRNMRSTSASGGRLSRASDMFASTERRNSAAPVSRGLPVAIGEGIARIDGFAIDSVSILSRGVPLWLLTIWFERTGDSVGRSCTLLRLVRPSSSPARRTCASSFCVRRFRPNSVSIAGARLVLLAAGRSYGSRSRTWRSRDA